jgi:hypothetical protein
VLQRRPSQYNMLTVLLCPRPLQGLCMLLQVCEDAFALADSDRLHQVFKQPEHQTCSARTGNSCRLVVR